MNLMIVDRNRERDAWRERKDKYLERCLELETESHRWMLLDCLVPTLSGLSCRLPGLGFRWICIGFFF
ncbi:hypothetical protein GIB67_033307 [Kingdonia uniflora]|uniref:Uncharacterized protein n=1 Tax=Kingdonia uniflora TaxID=39325 RepID=A0A7J7LBC2_9MAGN|nr:hypothetical protein GIB67_033307 [Kingdonia uniflora]